MKFCNPHPAGAVSTAKPSNWYIARMLTVLRLLQVPFFIVALVAGGTFWCHLIRCTADWRGLFSFLPCSTDWADGSRALA